jgi:hypothetical protein
MTAAFFNPDAGEAFDLFIGTAIGDARDLYELDGEIAFLRYGGTIETFDIDLDRSDLDFTGGQP